MASRLILIALAVALCGCDRHYDEIVDATRDAALDPWLDKYNLRISSCEEGFGVTIIYVKKRKEVRDGE